MNINFELAQPSEQARKVHFVIKVSKFCNLRCHYCYEYAELHQRAAMSLDQLDRMYAHLAHYYRQFGQSIEIELDWQGGEALLMPSDFYWQTFERQRQFFDGLSVKNAVQTNLTILTDDRIHLLKKGFDAVGVSIDLFGGLRVFQSGEDSQAKVLANLDRLRDNNIDFGCITVLTKQNVAYIPQIYQFYEALKVNSFRLLPLVKGAFDNQHQGYELSNQEVIFAFQELFEQLLTHSGEVHLDPLNRWIAQVMHHQVPEAQPHFYHKREWENVYLINTNGDVFSYADAYQTDWSHGNLFETSMEEIVLSEGHQKAIAAAEKRMAAVCSKCRFFGSCDGYPVAEESVLHQSTDPLDCGVEKTMLTYIEQRLRETGILESVSSPHFQASNLAPGLQVHWIHPESKQDPNRIQLSHGTTGVVQHSAEGLRYHPGARVPQVPWREPTSEERTRLISEGVHDSALSITVLKIPDRIRLLLEDTLDQWSLRDQWSPNSLNFQFPRSEALAALDRYLSQQLDLYHPEAFILYMAPPQLVTLTKTNNQERNPLKMMYLGLHVDTWDQTVSTTLAPSRRLCLNLGKEDRHFLFINLPLSELLQATGLTKSKLSLNRSRTLFSGYKFMKLYPNYPVVKLRIAPGEAYLAPTGQIIHDGTSLGKQYPDVTIHVIGSLGTVLPAIHRNDLCTA